MNARLYGFAGGERGRWRVLGMTAIAGEPLPAVARVEILAPGETPAQAGARWLLRGVTSNERYVVRPEKDELVARQPELGRPGASHAALIGLRKSAAWWALPQDERRAIFEAHSHHIRTGLKYLPAIARRLHHCRDLESAEPFDFLTWFEYAAGDAAAFERLVGELRASEEWRYVEREVDIRLACK
jgi:Chlorite dismutase